MVTDSAATSRIKMKTRAFIIIGTCVILVLSGIFATYWYYNAFERIKEMAMTDGFSIWILQVYGPTVVQLTASEKWFPTANSTPRQILEVSYDPSSSIYVFPNGTRLGYDIGEWERRLVNENQQKYSNQASIEATENTALTGLIAEAVLLEVAATMYLLKRRHRGSVSIFQSMR